MAKTVGINQRISISVIEMAMKASLDGVFTPEYAADLAAGEYQGAGKSGLCAKGQNQQFAENG